jgi:hypothetical protein
MLMYVQQASTAAALITSPCVLAFAFFALTCNLFLAFINICQNNTLASHPKRNINGLQKKRNTNNIRNMVWPDSPFWIADSHSYTKAEVVWERQGLYELNEVQAWTLTFTFVDTITLKPSWAFTSFILWDTPEI